MKNKVNDADIEYFKKYVNYGNEGFESSQGKKQATVGVFFVMPTLGIIFTISDWLNFPTLRIVFVIIMAGGMFCAIASGNWFSGNRESLFTSWLALTGTGATFFLIGIFMAYGVSSILFYIFVTVHALLALLAIARVAKRISGRKIPEGSGKKSRYYGLGGGFGLLGGIVFTRATEGVGSDIARMVLSAIFMAGAVVLWFGVEKLAQLCYAVKYNIDVENARDAQKGSFGVRMEFQCPLLGKAIEESLCAKVNYESEGLLKPDKLKAVKKLSNLSFEEIRQVCRNCGRFPLQEEKDNVDSFRKTGGKTVDDPGA